MDLSLDFGSLEPLSHHYISESVVSAAQLSGPESTPDPQSLSLGESAVYGVLAVAGAILVGRALRRVFVESEHPWLQDRNTNRIDPDA
ncbi:MAG: hypothetical protein M3Q70_02490 [bacterium]|nr:hypothetical protein [bacterium]